MELEVRGRLRRPLDRKKWQGWARAAIRSNEVDDIRKSSCCCVYFEAFVELSEQVLRFSCPGVDELIVLNLIGCYDY
jgi:hypothetical protein